MRQFMLWCLWQWVAFGAWWRGLRAEAIEAYAPAPTRTPFTPLVRNGGEPVWAPFTPKAAGAPGPDSPLVHALLAKRAAVEELALPGAMLGEPSPQSAPDVSRYLQFGLEGAGVTLTQDQVRGIAEALRQGNAP